MHDSPIQAKSDAELFADGKSSWKLFFKEELCLVYLRKLLQQTKCFNEDCTETLNYTTLVTANKVVVAFSMSCSHLEHTTTLRRRDVAFAEPKLLQ